MAATSARILVSCLDEEDVLVEEGVQEFSIRTPSGSWRQQLPSMRKLAVASLALAGVALCSGAVGAANGRRSGAAAADVAAVQEKEGVDDMYGTLGDGLDTDHEAKVIMDENESKRLTAKFANMSDEELMPQNDMHDGNMCPDNEEMHAGLCYEKCKELTDGVFPIRASPFSCCRAEPCDFFNSKFSNPRKSCEGLDVGKQRGRKICPHTVGDCLRNEELAFGICYKRCGLLTDWKFPFRASASMCCKYNTSLGCASPGATITNPADLSVGGAIPEMPWTELPHEPILQFAESLTTNITEQPH